MWMKKDPNGPRALTTPILIHPGIDSFQVTVKKMKLCPSEWNARWSKKGTCTATLYIVCKSNLSDMYECVNANKYL